MAPKGSGGRRKGGAYGGLWAYGAAGTLAAGLLLAYAWQQPEAPPAATQPSPPSQSMLQKLGDAKEKDARGDPGERLLTHLKSKGAVLGVKITSYPGGLRGVSSTVDVKAGGLLMTIPLDEVLYNETVAPEVQEACRKLPCNMSRALVALGAAYERSLGADSRFALFMETMPDQVNNFVGWPAPMLRLMEIAIPGSQGYLSAELREMRAANALLAKPLDVHLLIWAIAMVQSRAFGFFGGGDAMVSGAGFFNHHWDPEASVPMPKCDRENRKCYIMAGSTPIKAGQQVFFHYRPWSNLQLLIRYGFAVPGNEWGPEVSFAPLKERPAWLTDAGCREDTLRLRGGAGRKDAGALPMLESDLLCARAAALAQDAATSDGEVEALWAAGALGGEAVHGSHAAAAARGYRLMAEACRGGSERWLTADGVAALNDASQAKHAVAREVMAALAENLALLDHCDKGFAALAEKLER